MLKSITKNQVIRTALVVLTAAGIGMSVNANAAQSATTPDLVLAKELDSFDHALNEAYRQLMNEKDSTAQKILKGDQRAWIKQRNKICRIKTAYKDREAFISGVSNNSKTAKCVLKQTKKRLEPLRAELQAAFDRRNRPTSQASYPPYPEVWHRKLTMANSSWRPFIYKTPEGDYLIISRTKMWGKKKWGKGLIPSYISNVVFFFSGRSRVALTDSELEKLWVGLEFVKHRWIVTSPEGWRIGTTGLDSRQPARCPQTMNAYFFVTSQPSKGRWARPLPPYDFQKSLFERLNPPRKVNINHLCTDTGEKTLTQYVEAKGAVFYEMLADGTLFAGVSAGQGLVLRLNGKLESKSPLLGKELLWLPTEEIEAIQKVTGKTPYQDAQNAILRKFK